MPEIESVIQLESGVWPLELRLSPDQRTLTVAFDDGCIFALAVEYLRIASPSAEVQGHSHAERKVLGGKRDVQLLRIEPVGHYGVKLCFDDMHDTGIYSWSYLHLLGREHGTRWETYLQELEERGLTRDPKLRASKPRAS